MDDHPGLTFLCCSGGGLLLGWSRCCSANRHHTRLNVTCVVEEGGEYTYVNTRESTVGSSTWFVAHSVCTCVIRNGVNAKPTSFIEAHYLQTEEKAVLVFSF